MFVEFLQKNPKAVITIVGHTDLKGTDKDCQALSVERATAVKNFMVKKGVDAARIKVIGSGKKHPIWNPEDAEYKGKENRRVEIIVYQ